MAEPRDFIAVDWGTTNRRAYRIAPDGRVAAEFEDASGVLSVAPGEFPAAVGDIRARLGDVPLLLAGMVGSNRGWAEVPYVSAPAGLDALATAVLKLPDRVAIVPGVSIDQPGHADVMRGEEVQALGAVAGGLMKPDATICHPGTHAKWITLAGGQITRFATAMTGELFALIRDHSILAPQLGGEVAAGPAFVAGVDVSLSGRPLLETLFGVRSGMLTGQLHDRDAAAYASGLIIGSDVASHRHDGDGAIALIGRPELCALYAAALDRAGRSHATIDGAQAFVAGMTALYAKVPA